MTALPEPMTITLPPEPVDGYEVRFFMVKGLAEVREYVWRYRMPLGARGVVLERGWLVLCDGEIAGPLVDGWTVLVGSFWEPRYATREDAVAHAASRLEREIDNYRRGILTLQNRLADLRRPR